MTRRASPSGISLTDRDAAVIKGMLIRGDRQHDIAAWFGVNSARIAEIANDVAPDSYPVGLRVWWLPSCTIGTLGQGAEPLASAAPWPRCGKKFAA